MIGKFTFPTAVAAAIFGATAAQADQLFLQDTDPYNSIFRQVATNCRYPELFSQVRQSFSTSYHKVKHTSDLLAITHVHCANNAGSDPEHVKWFSYSFTAPAVGSNVTISIPETSQRNVTVIEAPARSGQFYMATFAGNRVGVINLGEMRTTDFIRTRKKLKKGTEIAVHTYRAVQSTAIGLPMCKGMPLDVMNKGRLKLEGGIITNIDLFATATPAQVAELINTNPNGSDQYCPFAIISIPAKDYEYDTILLAGDSNSVGTTIPDKDDLLAGIAERALCGDDRAFINCSGSGNSFAQRFKNGMSAHLLAGARWCDAFGQTLGTNDLSLYLLEENVSTEEKRILRFPAIARMKKIEAITIPPNTSVVPPPDAYTKLETQTLHANSAGVVNLNNYRRNNPDRLYTKVVDIAAIVTDPETGKWKVGPFAGEGNFSAAVDTPIITFETPVMTVARNGLLANLPVGTAGARVNVALLRIDDLHARMMTHDGLRQPVAEYLPKVAVTSGVAYLDALHYNADGVHYSIVTAMLIPSLRESLTIRSWPAAA